MTKLNKLALATLLVFSATSALAFQQQTHKQIAIDAVNYMQANPSTTNFVKLEAAAAAAGYTVAEIAEIIGQGAYDVDDFKDTYICGAITGDCVHAPVWNAGASLVAYTSYWHFQNHTQGPDAHGNDIGGYNYDKLTVWGAVDDLAAAWLVNDHLDDGAGGMTGTCVWFFGWSCSEDSEYNSYGVTEANYRQGSTSTKAMYEDFQNIPFQPIDNLGQHWYNQFLANPTFQTLGFVMHTTDLLQPHHVWTTSSLNHSGWESWVGDNYFSKNLNDSAAVTAALDYFNAVPSNDSDIRPIMTQGGAFAYENGGIVLQSVDHSERLVVGQKVIPHAIAMVVTILNHAADQFVGTSSANMGNNWSEIGGGARQISIGHDGAMWVTTANDSIYQWKDTWVKIGGSLKQVAVGSNDDVWGVQDDGDIWKRNFDTNSWTEVSGTLANISVGADGEVWGVQDSGAIYRRDHSANKWVRISGGLNQISVGSATQVWGSQSDGDVWQRNFSTNGWTKRGTGFKSVSVASDGTVWAIKFDREVYVYHQGSWQLTSGSFHVDQIAVGSQTQVTTVSSSTSNSKLWRRNF